MSSFCEVGGVSCALENSLTIQEVLWVGIYLIFATTSAIDTLDGQKPRYLPQSGINTPQASVKTDANLKSISTVPQLPLRAKQLTDLAPFLYQMGNCLCAVISASVQTHKQTQQTYKQKPSRFVFDAHLLFHFWTKLASLQLRYNRFKWMFPKCVGVLTMCIYYQRFLRVILTWITVFSSTLLIVYTEAKLSDPFLFNKKIGIQSLHSRLLCLAASPWVILDGSVQVSSLSNTHGHEYSHQRWGRSRSGPRSEDTQGATEEPIKPQDKGHWWLSCRAYFHYHPQRRDSVTQATGCLLIPDSFLHFATSSLLH